MQKQTYYQIDSKGKTREWSIEVSHRTDRESWIIINAGIQGGKMIETITKINSGKNVGKANETTIAQQAELDAQTEINNKVKKGYVTDLANVKTKGQTATINAPMKGYAYHPTGRNKELTIDKLGIRNKLVGIQRKLDGWRYRILVDLDGCTFYTSSGDITLEFPQIAESTLKSFKKIYEYVNKKYGITQYYLDGEVYNHDLGFQATASACGAGKNKEEQSELSKEQKELRDKMHFYLFDVCLDVPYTTREKVLNYFYSDIVKKVDTAYINANEAEIDKMFEQYLSEGYEGLMIRQLDMPYEFKRTKQLTKYKPLIDDEFEVVDFLKSISGDTLGALVCVMPDGRRFNTNLKDNIGTDKFRKEIWDNRQDYVGKWVTVEFLEYTDAGIPRLPRAKAFRSGKSND